ncbi:MAG: hypothetical protein ACLR0U_16720 [Enterocloster clostridioformis]
MQDALQSVSWDTVSDIKEVKRHGTGSSSCRTFDEFAEVLKQLTEAVDILTQMEVQKPVRPRTASTI